MRPRVASARRCKTAMPACHTRICMYVVMCTTISEPRIQHAKRQLIHRPVDSVPADGGSIMIGSLSDSRMSRIPWIHGQMHRTIVTVVHYTPGQFYTANHNSYYYSAKCKFQFRVGAASLYKNNAVIWISVAWDSIMSHRKRKKKYIHAAFINYIRKFLDCICMGFANT